MSPSVADADRLFVDRVRGVIRDWSRLWHKAAGAEYVAALEQLAPAERAAVVTALEDARQAMTVLNRPFLKIG